jgi:hypothetical protein
MSSTQLQDELERSFGDGPPAPPVGVHLEAGRRALRRRRAATVALGTVLVLGAGYATVAGIGASAPTTGEVVTEPTPSPTMRPSRGIGWDLGPVRYRDGVLEVHPDAVVHERIDNPFGYAAPRASAALDLTFEGQRTWVIAELEGDDPAYSVSLPDNNGYWASFADYVAAETDRTTGGDDGWPDTLVLDNQGAVVASPGSEVLQRTDDPQLGTVFAAPGVPTGAAVVRAAEDDQGYFVIWRVVDGELDVFAVPPADVVVATFPELLSYVRGKIARQEGIG